MNEENEKYSVIVEDKIKHIKVEEISDWMLFISCCFLFFEKNNN